MYRDSARGAHANRAFLRRAVAYLAQAGVDQFLDIGSGLPTVGNIHTLAQAMNPLARVVYVDNDPVAVRYSRQLLDREKTPHTVAIEADLRDPATILGHPTTRRLLDLRRPAGLLLVAVLHFVLDDDEARHAVRAFREALAPGSYLVLSHGTLDGLPADVIARFEAIYHRSSAPTIARSRAQIAALFGGLDIVEPGIVPTPLWHPDATRDPLADQPVRAGILAGVGRKP